MYGERLPATLRVSGQRIRGYPYFELRAYRGESTLHPRLKTVFAHAGMRPVVLGNLRFLLPFDSLQQRGRVWDRLNCDPSWITLRGDLRVSEITIYGARQPGGRIFEMSL